MTQKELKEEVKKLIIKKFPKAKPLIDKNLIKIKVESGGMEIDGIGVMSESKASIEILYKTFSGVKPPKERLIIFGGGLAHTVIKDEWQSCGSTLLEKSKLSSDPKCISDIKSFVKSALKWHKNLKRK